MAQDVVITPASGKIEFLDSSDNVDARINLSTDGNLEITSPGGDISLGDTTADLFIGDGTSNVDIIFEQDGEIRALTNKTLTIGSDSSNVDIKGASVTFTGADSAVFSGNVTAASFIGNGASLTGISAGAQDGIFLEYNKIVSSNYNVDNGVTALTACNDSDGISIASGVTVTISDSSGWVITGGDKNMGLDAMIGASNQTERTMRTGTIKPTLDNTYDLGDSAVGYRAIYGETFNATTITSTGLITASGGVAIGGTGAVNTLDDYEEGTFTPAYTSGVSGSYQTQFGTYTKVGRLVYIEVHIDGNSMTGDANQLKIGGLPFVSQNDNSSNGGLYHVYTGGTYDGGNTTTWLVNRNEAVIYAYNINGATWKGNEMSDLNGGYRIAGFYQTAT